MNPILRDEATGDYAAVADIHRRAFGQEDETRLVDALREGGWAKLSLIAQLDQHIVGHILFSELAIVGEARSISALSLAPVSVRSATPARRRG